MEYLTLNNGVQMPLVGFGTFMLSGETCTKSVAAAIESGYRMIDTAEAYGNEKEVGAGIKASGMDRKKLFLVTKVNFKSYENAEQTVLQCKRTISTCCSCIGRSQTITRLGAAWKSCIQKAKSGPSAFPTLSRTNFWI